MYSLLFSTLMTLIIASLDRRSKYQRHLADYLAIFFLLAGINYLFSSAKAQANIFEQTYLIRDPITNQVVYVTGPEKEKKNIREIQKEFMYKCKEKKEFHSDEALKCFKEAEEYCQARNHNPSLCPICCWITKANECC